MMKGKAIHNEEQPLASKSQRRREALELKSLASDLIKLSPARLGRVPLDDAVRSAIMEARQIRSNVASKRQLQYVAKLLRRTDPGPIVRTLEDFEGEARQLTGRQHRVEAWRDLLLESGDQAVSVLMKQRNDADTQSIRQLIRNTHKEAARGKPPAAARALFRALREMDEMDPLPPTTGS
jgi:ribosome-associated protein